MKSSGLSGHAGHFKFPQTQVIQLLNDQLFIFFRSWSGLEIQQKVIDEISHFLSAADADLEVTTPFEFIESLSSYANKVRISLLLANDIVHKTENKERYAQGCEIGIVYKKNNEVICASVGRFGFTAIKNEQRMVLSSGGNLLDDQVLLPTQLLGLDPTPIIQINSISTKGLSELVVDSDYFNQSTVWKISLIDFE